jgi:hypothetical protein
VQAHTDSRYRAVGNVTAADAAGVELCALPTVCSTATSSPAPIAAAETNTR